MIGLHNVRKRYGPREVLAGVDAAFGASRITALVGPNGSGKTTLIKLVLGLATADSGEVTVDDVPVDAHGAHRARLGYMPQIARFPEHLRLSELLRTIRALRPGAQADERLIGELGLSREMDKPLGTLSGGTRQKVNAVIAFMFDPQILVLDEPTAGLDPVASRQLKRRVRRARISGCTVLITSHVLSEIEELADDVAFLQDGRLRFHGPVRDLLVRTRQRRLEDAIAVFMEPGAQEHFHDEARGGRNLTLINGGLR